MNETMYYVYSKKDGRLLAKTTHLADIDVFLPELVEIVIY